MLHAHDWPLTAEYSQLFRQQWLIFDGQRIPREQLVVAYVPNMEPMPSWFEMDSLPRLRSACCCREQRRLLVRSVPMISRPQLIFRLNYKPIAIMMRILWVIPSTRLSSHIFVPLASTAGILRSYSRLDVWMCTLYCRMLYFLAASIFCALPPCHFSFWSVPTQDFVLTASCLCFSFFLRVGTDAYAPSEPFGVGMVASCALVNQHYIHRKQPSDRTQVSVNWKS